jgi:hypothetical protein
MIVAMIRMLCRLSSIGHQVGQQRPAVHAQAQEQLAIGTSTRVREVHEHPKTTPARLPSTVFALASDSIHSGG